MLIDYAFHYKHVSRFILLHQSAHIRNTYMIPTVDKVILFFSIRHWENLEDVSLYNYYYLFRFFYGKKAYISKYKVLFSLRKYYHSFDIKIFFTARDVFYPIAFFLAELNPLLVPEYVEFVTYTHNSGIFIIRIHDLTLFTDKKTNLGLFNLRHSLNMKFFIAGGE
jgi:hypothetical protein